MWLYYKIMWLYDAPNHMTVSLLTGALPCEKWGQISCCTSTTDHQPPHTINVCSPPQHEWPTSGNSDTLSNHLAKTAYSNSFCKGWGGGGAYFCLPATWLFFLHETALSTPQSPQFSSWGPVLVEQICTASLLTEKRGNCSTVNYPPHTTARRDRTAMFKDLSL